MILTYLFARLKGKTEEKPEAYLQPLTKDFPVTEEYFDFILDSMVKEGLIEGIKFIRAWGGDIINVTGMSGIRITHAGIDYLQENKSMQEVLEWMRDNAVSMPGMVTTVMGILQG